MIRNFRAAQLEFEAALLNDSQNTALKKKLIICFILAGKVSKALDAFLMLLSDRSEILIKPRLPSEEELFQELIYEFEENYKNDLDLEELNIGLGILWACWDIASSIRYFENAGNINFDNSKIRTIKKILKSFVQSSASEQTNLLSSKS